jgi:hypothetical protein
MSTTPTSTSPSTRLAVSPATATRWLRPLALLALLLLAIQFLIGMVINLFATLPASHPGTNAPEYFSGVAVGVAWALGHGNWWLRLHAIDGLLLFLDSLVLIWFAIVVRQRAWITATIVGWFGIVSAGFNGASFMNYGHDFSSLFMSIGFLIALIAYAAGVYITR